MDPNRLDAATSHGTPEPSLLISPVGHPTGWAAYPSSAQRARHRWACGSSRLQWDPPAFAGKCAGSWQQDHERAGACFSGLVPGSPGGKTTCLLESTSFWKGGEWFSECLPHSRQRCEGFPYKTNSVFLGWSFKGNRWPLQMPLGEQIMANLCFFSFWWGVEPFVSRPIPTN